MTRNFRKDSILKNVVYVALIYCLFFDSFLIWHRFASHKNFIGLALGEVVIEYGVGFILSTILFYSFSFSQKLFKIAVISFFVTTGFSCYFLYKFKVEPSYSSIAVLLEATTQEALSFLSVGVIFVIFFTIILSWVIVKKVSFKGHFTPKHLLALTAFFSIIFLDADFTGRFFPYNFLIASKEYGYEKIGLKTKRLDLASFEYNLLTPAKDLKVVLMIGESARADHFAINGYHRDTSSQLNEIPNLVNYPNVRACALLTRDAVPCMLTRATESNFAPVSTETSIISIFNKLGFQTYWIGTQGTYSVIDSPFTDLTKEANHRSFLSADLSSEKILDIALVTELSGLLKSDYPNLTSPFSKTLEPDCYEDDGDQICSSPADALGPSLEEIARPNQFIVLHSFGSHFHYESRYPKDFRKFQPICKKGFFESDLSNCTQEQIVNSYDNSINYTSHIISEIIKQLHDENALFIYISDHGEHLGENGLYLHGFNDAPHLRAVPMFVWASDRFSQNYPEQYQNILKNKLKQTDHNFIFHSLLDCIGVDSKILDTSSSFCRSL